MGALANDCLCEEASRMKKKRKHQINGAFAPRTIEMLRAPAWSVLSLSARRLLDRIEIELASHGGKDNGQLPITYDDFENYGIERHSIGPAQREVEALGFVEIILGVAGNADFRRSNMFRLTYRPAEGKRETNEWRKIKTEAEAKKIATKARTRYSAAKVRSHKFPSGGKSQIPVGVSRTGPSGGFPH
jgi:hypothetical protein